MESTAAAAPTVDWPARCWPRIVSVGRFTQEDRGFARDYANDCLTLHLFAYACRMRSGDQEWEVRPDHLVATPPGARQAFDIPQPGVHWALLVQPQHAQRGGSPLRLPRHLALARPQAAEARSRLERLHEDHQRGGGRGDHPASLAASAGAQAVLCWLAALDLGGDGAADPRRAAALRKAEDLLANPLCARVPVAEIAHRAGMSQNRLAAAFRERHGLGMHAYRDRALLAFAQQWLATTDADLATIARQVELPDGRRFNKWFRRLTGLSPSAWRAARPPLVTSAARPPVGIEHPPVAPPARRLTPPG